MQGVRKGMGFGNILVKENIIREYEHVVVFSFILKDLIDLFLKIHYIYIFLT